MKREKFKLTRNRTELLAIQQQQQKANDLSKIKN